MVIRKPVIVHSFFLSPFVTTEKAQRQLTKQSRNGNDAEDDETSADEDDLLVIHDEDDEDDGELVKGSMMHVEVRVIEAYDLPPALCNYVFCQYKFWNDDNTIVVPPINASISNPGPKTNTMIFEHKQVNALLSIKKLSFGGTIKKSDCTTGKNRLVRSHIRFHP